MTRVLIDTNLLVYAVSVEEHAKCERARSVLRELARTRLGVVSTQVVQEFFSVLVRKRGVSTADARRLCRDAMQFEVQVVDATVIERGMDVCVLESISVWDAMIIAAAERAGCDEVWSEDLQHGGRYGAVRVHNPF